MCVVVRAAMHMRVLTYMRTHTRCVSEVGSGGELELFLGRVVSCRDVVTVAVRLCFADADAVSAADVRVPSMMRRPVGMLSRPLERARAVSDGSERGMFVAGSPPVVAATPVSELPAMLSLSSLRQATGVVVGVSFSEQPRSRHQESSAPAGTDCLAVRVE